MQKRKLETPRPLISNIRYSPNTHLSHQLYLTHDEKTREHFGLEYTLHHEFLEATRLHGSLLVHQGKCTVAAEVQSFVNDLSPHRLLIKVLCYTK